MTKGSRATGAPPILVAVDLSPCSAAALTWAARAARREACPLVVLHVVHDPEDAPGKYRNSDDDAPAEPLESAATRQFEEFLAARRAEDDDLRGLPAVEDVLVVGLPATRIVEVAEAHGARQIVVGSRGRTGLRHLLLGSKALRVAQLAPMPVTIVKAAHERENESR